MDGVAFGSPSLVGCGRVFHTCRGFVKGCFAVLYVIVLFFKLN